MGRSKLHAVGPQTIPPARRRENDARKACLSKAQPLPSGTRTHGHHCKIWRRTTLKQASTSRVSSGMHHRRHPPVLKYFPETEIYNRKKDIGSATAKWFADLLSSDPWWKNVVPDVSIVHVCLHTCLPAHSYSFARSQKPSSKQVSIMQLLSRQYVLTPPYTCRGW